MKLNNCPAGAQNDRPAAVNTTTQTLAPRLGGEGLKNLLAIARLLGRSPAQLTLLMLTGLTDTTLGF